MAKPEEVVDEDEYYCLLRSIGSTWTQAAWGQGGGGKLAARQYKDGIGQLDNGEMAQVAHVDAMAGYAHEG